MLQEKNQWFLLRMSFITLFNADALASSSVTAITWYKKPKYVCSVHTLQAPQTHIN